MCLFAKQCINIDLPVYIIKNRELKKIERKVKNTVLTVIPLQLFINERA